MERLSSGQSGTFSSLASCYLSHFFVPFINSCRKRSVQCFLLGSRRS